MTQSLPRSVAILGGGISGLSSAYYLLDSAAKRGISLAKVYLLESQPRFGGYLQTASYGPNVDQHFELGPRTISTNSYAGTNAIALVGNIGLANNIKYVSKNYENFNKRYILIDGKLLQLPSKLFDIFSFRLPFKPFIFYAVKDLLTRRIDLQATEDVSVDSFFKYRFGNDVADYLANPLCVGITGGNSKALSMKSMFPNLLKKEQLYGSVVRAMFTKEDIYKDLADHWLVKKSIDQKWAVFSFDEGIQALPDQICSFLRQNYSPTIELMHSTEVTEMCIVEKSKISLKVKQIEKERNNSLQLQVDHIFSSIPAYKLASILKGDHEKLSHTLQSISTVHMGVVCLLFDRNVLPSDVAGFGFLVPSSESSPILGVTFDSCIFPIADSNYIKVTVMLGGYRFEELFGTADSVSPDSLLQISLGALKSYLNIGDKPVQHLVSIHKNCIPQYNVGHEQKIDIIESEISNLNLSLAGASFYGFSVPDCILNAKIQIDKWIAKQNK